MIHMVMLKEILQSNVLAEILQEMVTDGHGICARFGGDEYMVVQLMEAEK